MRLLYISVSVGDFENTIGICNDGRQLVVVVRTGGRPHLRVANGYRKILSLPSYWLPPDLHGQAVATYLLEVTELEWPEALLLLHSELHSRHARCFR